jgi:hypothetical protein
MAGGPPRADREPRQEFDETAERRSAYTRTLQKRRDAAPGKSKASVPAVQKGWPPAWTLDLSLGGLFVQASRALSLGSTARVSVELNSGTAPLCVTARVVRVPGDNCMGLQI